MANNAIATPEQLAIENVKRCTRCGNVKQRTTEFFPPHKHTSDKLDSWCRNCRKIYRAELHIRNHDRELQQSQSYRDANKEVCLARTRRWRAENPDYHRLKSVEWRSTHEQEVRLYAEENRFMRTENATRWAKENPDKVNAKTHRYRARKRGNGGSYTPSDVQLQVASQTDKHGELHCWWCGQSVSAYHIDHAIPLARGGSNSAGNIVISCAACNRKKNAKTPQEFAGRLF